MITKQMSHCKAHWSEFLSWFNFAIQYCSGKLNSCADALICWSDDFSQDNQDSHHACHQQLVIKSHNLSSVLQEHLSLQPATLKPVTE